MLSFVESMVNEKGSSPLKGSPVVLSFIVSVKVATSQSLRGDLETRLMLILFCVIKC